MHAKSVNATLSCTPERWPTSWTRKAIATSAWGESFGPSCPTAVRPGSRFRLLGRQPTDVGFDCRPEILKFLAAIPAESMVVFDPGKEKVCAAWGEFMALAARNNGCRGVVVDGPIRDTEMVIEAGFQIFGTGFWPVSSVGRWRPVHCGKTILMHGVEVRSGDLVLGDIDGVVVVPQPLIEEVLLAAEDCYRAERSMKEELRAGKTMEEVFKKYGRW